MLFANSPKCPKSSFPTQTLHLGPLFANSPRGHQLQCPAERHGHGHPDHVVPGLGSAERGRSAALGRRDHIQRRASVTDACSHLGRRKILDRFRGQMRSWQVLGEHAGPVKHCFIGVVCVCVCVCSWPGVFGYVSPPPPHRKPGDQCLRAVREVGRSSGAPTPLGRVRVQAKEAAALGGGWTDFRGIQRAKMTCLEQQTLYHV